ncbi:hypothetical protein N7470_008454 [Penicillium chermesinum]|nr:hypothetical protein N7470_008454 [Penicillium chermesinum]
MVLPTGNDRAIHLAREAVELVDAGCVKESPRSSFHRPEHPEVRSAFLKIQQEEGNGHPLLDFCQRYTTRQDESAGKEAVAYLRTDGLKPPENVALDCLKLLLSQRAHALSETQDEIISGLVRQNASVRQYFSTQLQISVTTFFDEIYDRGDGAAVCLDTVVLDPAVWPSEETRRHCESELFQLFLAKLMESGHDLDGRSLKGITRLLAVDAGSCSIWLMRRVSRLPLELRSQATLATAKYLEAAKETGEKQFAGLVLTILAKGRLDDYVIAFSAVAAVFPVAQAAAANVFLSEEFMGALTSLATRDAKRRKVEIAVLELLNAACVNRPCREAVTKNFSEWLSHSLTNGSDEGSELAAIRASETVQPPAEISKVEDADTGVSELVQRFKGLMSESKTENIAHPIEGLAYSSVNPSVKEQLAKDPSFMRDLISVLKKHTTNSSVLYGGLMIIFNITKFLPNLSDEQKKMSQLKDYADASTGKARAAPNPLDEEDAVVARCGAVIQAGAMSLLVECGKLAMPSVHDLTAQILLALTRPQKSRGTLAQQGAVKLLLGLAIPKQGDAIVVTETAKNASHALARILISVDPSHVFPSSGFPQATSAVRPLLSLLTSPETASFSADQPRDLLPVFESLLALTNLASHPTDDSPAELTVREGWPAIEDLLLSGHSRVQRAACELVCNLMTCESGIVKFADGSKRAAQRLHVLLALTDADDLLTRRAAGGAMAMLTGYDAAVAAVLDRPRGVDLLLGMCKEDDEPILHRGAVCVQNLTCTASGDIGARAKTAVRAAGGVEVLTECIKKTSNPAVIQAAVEALKPLVGQQK